MTDAQIKAEQEAIERDYNALYQRVDAVCRAVVEKVCKRTGWDFSSHYSTRFTTKVPHEYQPNHTMLHEHEPWPADFQQVWDWANSTPAEFPDMIYEDGRWVA